MSLLRDAELVKLIQTDTPLVSDLKLSKSGTWFDLESPIQPSSIDLHIGAIHIPAKGLLRPSRQISSGKFALKPGRTAMIETAESLAVPDNLAAVGFPPAHLSVRGLLMTNPGHVDPGYRGKLHLTVINMSKKRFDFECGSAIITILFWQLNQAAEASYSVRLGNGSVAGTSNILENVKVLAHDFVQVDKRARAIARKTLVWAVLWVGVVTAVITTASQVFAYYFSGVEQLKRDNIVLKQEVKQMLDSQMHHVPQQSPASVPKPENPK